LEPPLLRDFVIILLAIAALSVLVVGFELVLFLHLLLDLGFLRKNLISIRKHLPHLALGLGITLFDFVDYEAAVPSNSEQLLVVVSETHALNF
jgi:hypothetical protein